MDILPTPVQKSISIRIVIHNPEMINLEATLKPNMMEPA